MIKPAYFTSFKGFTLVELMVVITIIAILSTIGLTIYTGAQKSARMSKRIRDLSAAQTALELYYSANKAYPCSSAVCTTPPGKRSECAFWGTYASDQVIPGLIPSYMVVFPSDPRMNVTDSQHCYIYQSNGIDYKLGDYNIFASEMNQSDFKSQKNLVDPYYDGGPTDSSSATSCDGVGDGSFIQVWSVYTYGARCWN